MKQFTSPRFLQTTVVEKSILNHAVKRTVMPVETVYKQYNAVPRRITTESSMFGLKEMRNMKYMQESIGSVILIFIWNCLVLLPYRAQPYVIYYHHYATPPTQTIGGIFPFQELFYANLYICDCHIYQQTITFLISTK